MPDAITPELVDTAVALLRQAGELTLTYFRNPDLAIDRKGDGTPVTVADRAAERMLREEIENRFPDDGILGEEEAEKIGTSGRRWIIDPIDGTKAFTHGVPLYTNLLALEDSNGIALGVINVPALGETVWAGRGRGCFLDGARCSVSDRAELSGSYLSVTGFHEWTPDMFDRVTGSGLQLRTWGDAYGYALVASGRVEAMFDPALAWWDLAAMLVVIPEAGGTLTSWSGGDPAVENIDHPEYRWSAIASNGAFHDRLVEVLAR